MSAGPRIETAVTAGFRSWVLHDDAADLHATWMPGAGMLGASLVHHGEELLWRGAGPGAYARERKFMGIPFLHPWANRLARFGYRADGHDVVLDPSSPLIRLDEHGLPIHGVLTASRRWVVQEIAAASDHARLVAGLNFDRPELLAAFPFPHRVEIEVQLGDAALQVRTTVIPTSAEQVPLAFGFHPYLQIPGVPRANWEVSFPVRRHLLLDGRLIPTGDTEPVSPLTGLVGERTWDNGFDGFRLPARFELRGGGRVIGVEYDNGYPVAQVFAPPGKEYLCIEPMTAPANALNGPASALAWVPAGERRSATFKITCRLES